MAFQLTEDRESPEVTVVEEYVVYRLGTHPSSRVLYYEAVAANGYLS
jgi:hypothetical protein